MPTSTGQRAERGKRSSTMTRRAFLVTLAVGFTAIAEEMIWLMRVCRFGHEQRLAGA